MEKNIDCNITLCYATITKVDGENILIQIIIKYIYINGEKCICCMCQGWAANWLNGD